MTKTDQQDEELEAVDIIDHLAQQTYLDPHPIELMLRNHG